MKRIVAIDTLRGFALLGILLMNIMSFAMPAVAYYNPTVYGGQEWYNRLTYAFVHVLADQKFMALFSLLFGASVTLLLTKLREREQNAARFHYTRNFWLLVIGILHSLLWYGDILAIYAVSAFVLFFFRNMQARWQFIIGLLLFLSPALLYFGADAIINTTYDGDYSTLEAVWNPPAEVLNAEVEAVQAGELASDPFSEAGDNALGIYTLAFAYNAFIRALGMMLIGMAFFTWGIVTAQKSDAFYRRLLLVGFGVGIPLAVLGLWLHESANWAVTYSPMIGQIPNLLATPLIASAYVALIMLWSRTELWQALQLRLAAVGQMALTNYILQTLLATFLFYGYGLGWFGTLDRFAQLGVVLAIWGLQLVISPLWMARFRYGPLEWLWRTLSYGKLQPIRRQPIPVVT